MSVNMVEYLDMDNKKLEKGFYSYTGTEDLVYFTGEYNEESKFPIFEKEKDEGDKGELPIFVVRRLYKIAKEETRERLSKLKKTTQWLEKRVEEENERTL